MATDEEGYETNPGRFVDIELGDQEEVAIDLDNLDADPKDILELLREANPSVWKWITFAGEYWRKGLHSAAEEICQAAIVSFTGAGAAASLWPIYVFQANLQLEYARKAPKMILNARKDIVADGKTKQNYHTEATRLLNATETGRDEAGDGDAFQSLTNLTRSLYLLSTRSLDAAFQGFENVLASKPTNIPALLGKARIFYARRDYISALRHFQRVLSLSPRCKPDPRIGIGLCLWAMGNQDKARAAWERSIELNPTEWASHVILGLDDINRSKDIRRSDEERSSAYTSGSKHIERAFRSNNKSASAANALSEFFLRKGDLNNATKLAERTMQFADTLTILNDGHLRMARVYHTEGNVPSAMKHYQAAAESQPKHVLASLGLAQMQLESSEIPAAIHTLETLLQPPNAGASSEGSVMLASLRANPRPGVSSADVIQDKLRAREMFDHIIRTIEQSEIPSGDGKVSRSMRTIKADMDMYLEIARLWQQDNPEKMTRALKEALRIGQTTGKPNYRIINNLAALKHSDGELEAARSMYEDALRVSSSSTEEGDMDVSSSILYNLARVYEAQDQINMAREAYDKLLQHHPEYIDARIRQAQLLKNTNQINDAHELLKQALASQSQNLNLRAFYTYFLMESNLIRPAKDFVFATLKDHDKHDLYSLCSAGLIMYQQARENRDTTAEGLKTRRRNFERSIEFYEKALSLDPMCAVAAQGLAIVTAEDALGTFGSTGIADDPVQRLKHAREALDVFAKVRDTMADGSVYANMGHCYYARDEFDRAIESYETASKRFYNQQNVPVLLCLSRSNYAKATKDQSYLHMGIALDYAKKALHLNPHDKAIVYNIAMIEQKAAETLFALDPSKRSLEDLRKGIEHAEHAQSLFSSLASDKANSLPYSRDIADQRRKYGESMLRKADEHLAVQEAHEVETKERLDAARQRREEERDRKQALERERMEKLRKEAEELAQERKKARDEAQAWTAAAKAESDEEREKRPKKSAKKSKNEAESGEDGEIEGDGKKKRKSKLRRNETTNGHSEVPVDADDAGLFSGDEVDQPKKRVPKKRVVRDDEDDEQLSAPPKKKLIKSKETISDSDEMLD